MARETCRTQNAERSSWVGFHSPQICLYDLTVGRLHTFLLTGFLTTLLWGACWRKSQEAWAAGHIWTSRFWICQGVRWDWFPSANLQCALQRLHHWHHLVMHWATSPSNLSACPWCNGCNDLPFNIQATKLVTLALIITNIFAFTVVMDSLAQEATESGLYRTIPALTFSIVVIVKLSLPACSSSSIMCYV